MDERGGGGQVEGWMNGRKDKWKEGRMNRYRFEKGGEGGIEDKHGENLEDKRYKQRKGEKMGKGRNNEKRIKTGRKGEDKK